MNGACDVRVSLSSRRTVKFALRRRIFSGSILLSSGFWRHISCNLTSGFAAPRSKEELRKKVAAVDPKTVNMHVQ